jgi:hypothetical protein
MVALNSNTTGITASPILFTLKIAPFIQPILLNGKAGPPQVAGQAIEATAVTFYGAGRVNVN